MKERKKEALIAESIFKGENTQIQKAGFNMHYERYINFHENKI